MPKENLTKKFVHTIKQRILNGEYKIGDSFPPLRKLAQEFECSRSVINVGIARLEEQGYLLVQKRQKTITNDFINRGSLDTVKDMALCQNCKLRKKAAKDILEARLLIELKSVKAAAANPQDLEELFEVIEREEKLVKENSKDYHKLAEYDFKFHYRLIKMSGNMVYFAVMNSFKDTALEMTKIFYKNNIERFKEYVEKHRLIADAISQKDGERAAEILEEILTHGEKLYKIFND